MENFTPKPFDKWFGNVATKVTKATGNPIVVVLAFLVVIVWGATGPVFHYSENWQLIINTGTTIITFLMVFIIQHSQNKDTTAMQIKLNELLAANNNTSNRVVNIEDLSEPELMLLKSFYKKLSEAAQEEKELFTTHSVDEANQNVKVELSDRKAMIND